MRLEELDGAHEASAADTVSPRRRLSVMDESHVFVGVGRNGGGLFSVSLSSSWVESLTGCPLTEWYVSADELAHSAKKL